MLILKMIPSLSKQILEVRTYYEPIVLDILASFLLTITLYILVHIYYNTRYFASFSIHYGDELFALMRDAADILMRMNIKKLHRQLNIHTIKGLKAINTCIKAVDK